jgi:pentatricopeptide repeat protein
MLYMDIVKAGFELDLHIGNALVDTYSKCGSFDESCIVFDKLPSRSVVVLWPSMVAGYLRHGRGQEAVELFKEMQKERSPPPDNITYLHLIKACTGMGDIASGHFIHAHMFHIGIDLDPYIQSSLVEMYARSGKLGDAKKVFDMSPRNDHVLLAVMSTAYVDSGQEEQSLYLLAKMMQSDVEPDKVLFLCLLKSCMSMLAMEQGRLVHSHILKQGFYLDLHIASALIDMYAQCGSIQDAYNVFENMPNRDAACWNVLISSLSDNGHSQEALYMYEKMQQNCSSHCEVTSCSVLTACSNVGAIDKGKLIHLDVVKNGGDSLSTIANALVDLYGKCGNLEDAYDVFKKLQGKDVISWSSIISAHVQNWHCEEAFYLFDKMQEAGFDPDHVTFACMAKACANTKSKRYGEFVHSEVTKRGMNSDSFVGNAMVSMYAKMGDIIATLKVFESLAKVQAVAWNSLMWGLSELDMNEKAFQLFREMQREDVVQLDPITYVSIMKSLSDAAGLSAVRVLHIDIICQGFESNIMVQNILIVVYAKCGSINDASAVFQLMQIRSIISWNIIIDSYGEHGDYAFVLHCLEGMQEEGIVPNSATFVCILSACSHGGLIEEAYKVYNTMTETVGLIASVQHTVCMIDALGRAGCLDEATALLSGIPFQPDSAMWINLLGSSAKYKHITIGDWAFEHLQQLDPTNAAGYMLLSNIYSNSYSLETAYHFRESMAFCRL